MSKGQSAEEEAALAKFRQSSRQMETTAVELVDAGRALFKDGEPADRYLQRRSGAGWMREEFERLGRSPQ